MRIIPNLVRLFAIVPVVLFAAVLVVLTAVPVNAQQQSLSPESAQVQIRAFGLGFFPLDGNFARFHGWIRYDPSHPAACQVMLEVDAGSLTMPNQSVRDLITGPDFMDVARYPDLAFDGTCQGDAINGTLRLHGESHPFGLDLTRKPERVTATGRLRRGDWGIKTRSLIAGSTIRIRIEAPNPLSGPHT